MLLLLLSFPLCHTSGRLVAPPLNPTAGEWLIEELRAPASPEHSSPSMLDLGRWVVFDYGPLIKARGFPESTNQLWALPHQALTQLRRFRVKGSELSSHRKLSIDLLPETWQILVISPHSVPITVSAVFGWCLKNEANLTKNVYDLLSLKNLLVAFTFKPNCKLLWESSNSWALFTMFGPKIVFMKNVIF